MDKYIVYGLVRWLYDWFERVSNTYWKLCFQEFWKILVVVCWNNYWFKTYCVSMRVWFLYQHTWAIVTFSFPKCPLLPWPGNAMGARWGWSLLWASIRQFESHQDFYLWPAWVICSVLGASWILKKSSGSCPKNALSLLLNVSFFPASGETLSSVAIFLCSRL